MSETRTLFEYIKRSIPLIPVYETGAAIASFKDTATLDVNTIEDFIAGKDTRTHGYKISRFYFYPSEADWLVLDIDCKNGKDGIKEFYDFCEQLCKPKELLPKVLQDIPNSVPCYVKTPNNGYHLYFKYTGDVKRACLTPAVEIKGGNRTLTAAGSYKNGKQYILCGTFENIPALPLFLAEIIESPQPLTTENNVRLQKPQSQKRYRTKLKQWVKKERDKRDYSWDEIVAFTDKDTNGICSGRNDRAFAIACHAKTHGYTADETISSLLRETSIEGLPTREIEAVVKSAYKK
jgi:hypothetical protein